MEAIRTGSNANVVVTDEHTSSSYGIPVIVINGGEYEGVYGDSDSIDGVLDGKCMKKQFAESEFRDNEEMYNWVIKGTDLPTWKEHREECDRKQAGFNALFGRK